MLRKQFPLMPCAAMTIHKSQGSTLPKVAISFEGRAQDHLAYVALSRAKSLQGLNLLNFDSNKIRVSADVMREMKRLRQDPLIPCKRDSPYLPKEIVTTSDLVSWYCDMQLENMNVEGNEM